MMSWGFWIIVAVLLCALAEAGMCIENCVEKWIALKRIERARIAARRERANRAAGLADWERSKGRV